MITRIGVVLWLLGNPVMGGSKVHLQVVGDWGASKADVEKVLQSAAVPLWRMFPDRDLSVIKVEPQGGPIVLFGRGSEGEYRMRLNTGGTYWSQYAYAQNYIDQARCRPTWRGGIGVTRSISRRMPPTGRRTGSWR